MERVDALIERVMAQFPGVSAYAQARFYEEVHQELAPLAREIELQRDKLLEAPKVGAGDTAKDEAVQNFSDLPLCSSPLSRDEVIRLHENLMPLLRFLGSPGDWGYKTKLGRLTIVLGNLRAEVARVRDTAPAGE